MGVGVDGFDGAAGQQLDVVADIEVAVVHARRLGVGLAAQDGLGEWWSLVGQLVFVADEDDTPVEAGGACAFSGVGAGEAGADDDERLVSGHGQRFLWVDEGRGASGQRWGDLVARSWRCSDHEPLGVGELRAAFGEPAPGGGRARSVSRTP